MFRSLLLPLVVATTALTAVVFQPVSVFAVDVIDPACESADPANLPTVCTENSNADPDSNPLVGPNGIITNVTQALVYVIATISALVIVIGAIKYTLSGGDPNATKSAKDTIMYALIGLAVAIISQTLVLFVLERLSF